jgi:hypothetical protein
MNDLFAMCGSGRSGTSCHSLAIFHLGGNGVSLDLWGKLANTRRGLAQPERVAFRRLWRLDTILGCAIGYSDLEVM